MFFHWISISILVGLFALVVCDVFGRLLFDYPIVGVSELMGQAVVIFVFLQAPQTFRKQRFLRNNSLLFSLNKDRPNIARILTFALHLAAALILIVLLFFSVPFLVSDWVNDDYVGAIGTLAVPTWPARLSVIVGGFVLVQQILFGAFKSDESDPNSAGINL